MKQKALGMALLGAVALSITAQAGMITGSDGLWMSGSSWPVGANATAELVGWTVTATGSDIEGVLRNGTTTNISFASNGYTSLAVGDYYDGNRIGYAWFRNAASSLDATGAGVSGGYSWFSDGDALDLSTSANTYFNEGMVAGSDNWFIIKLDGTAINYTGYTEALGVLNEVAIQMTWNDADLSGTRSVDDVYTVGTMLYATGTSTFDGGSWIGGAPVAIPEPATLGLIATFGGGIMFMRRRLMS